MLGEEVRVGQHNSDGAVSLFVQGRKVAHGLVHLNRLDLAYRDAAGGLDETATESGVRRVICSLEEFMPDGNDALVYLYDLGVEHVGLFDGQLEEVRARLEGDLERVRMSLGNK